MKIQVITIGQPKLSYAKQGWEEYWKRLGHFHQLRATHIADKNNDAQHLLEAIGNSYAIGLIIEGNQMTSEQLAGFLEKRQMDGRELTFVIGGPEGLPPEVIKRVDYQWSFGLLTLPHDLAMVVLLEALYRASTISAGLPYHRA